MTNRTLNHLRKFMCCSHRLDQAWIIVLDAADAGADR
jgi:hypothetical protein